MKKHQKIERSGKRWAITTLTVTLAASTFLITNYGSVANGVTTVHAATNPDMNNLRTQAEQLINSLAAKTTTDQHSIQGQLDALAASVSTPDDIYAISLTPNGNTYNVTINDTPQGHTDLFPSNDNSTTFTVKIGTGSAASSATTSSSASSATSSATSSNGASSAPAASKTLVNTNVDLTEIDHAIDQAVNSLASSGTVDPAAVQKTLTDLASSFGTPNELYTFTLTGPTDGFYDVAITSNPQGHTDLTTANAPAQHIKIKVPDVAAAIAAPTTSSAANTSASAAVSSSSDDSIASSTNSSPADTTSAATNDDISQYARSTKPKPVTKPKQAKQGASKRQSKVVKKLNQQAAKAKQQVKKARAAEKQAKGRAKKQHWNQIKTKRAVAKAKQAFLKAEKALTRIEKRLAKLNR